MPRFSIGYLLDIIYNRDLWMHRMDLARATGQPFQAGGRDRHIIEHAVRDLAQTWPAAPVTLELTGPAGGTWLIGSGEPAVLHRASSRFGLNGVLALSGAWPATARAACCRLDRGLGSAAALGSGRRPAACACGVVSWH
jgi:hypothetical protein